MFLHILRWSDLGKDEDYFIADVDFEAFTSLLESIKRDYAPQHSTFSSDKAYIIRALSKHNIRIIKGNRYTLWRFFD